MPQGGIGVAVPAPFKWPLEGVPAFSDVKLMPTGGLCIGGDNCAMRCNELQECAGGYCELHGPQAFSCVDAPGANADTLCSRMSQCPYGRCNGLRPQRRAARAGRLSSARRVPALKRRRQ